MESRPGRPTVRTKVWVRERRGRSRTPLRDISDEPISDEISLPCEPAVSGISVTDHPVSDTSHGTTDTRCDLLTSSISDEKAAVSDISDELGNPPCEPIDESVAPCDTTTSPNETAPSVIIDDTE